MSVENVPLQSERHRTYRSNTWTKQEYYWPRTPQKYGKKGLQAYEARNSYTIRRRTCKPQLKVMRPEHHKHIISELEQYWSPEQIIWPSWHGSCDSLKALPCHTLTVDNGKEFAAHKAITAESKVPVGFAYSHSPWERPTNGNTNGLLRQFFPKYRSFLTVTQEHLDHAIHLLNNRPRKCLNWETPYQALAEELLHLIWQTALRTVLKDRLYNNIDPVFSLTPE